MAVRHYVFVSAAGLLYLSVAIVVTRLRLGRWPQFSIGSVLFAVSLVLLPTLTATMIHVVLSA